MASQWLVSGNSGTDPSNNFLGTSDNQPLVIKTNNAERLRVNANGNVGIGTPNPNRSLTIANTSNANYVNVKAGDREILLGVHDIGGILSVMSDQDLIIRTGGNKDRMLITNEGFIKTYGPVQIGASADANVYVGPIPPQDPIFGKYQAKMSVTKDSWSYFAARFNGPTMVDHDAIITGTLSVGKGKTGYVVDLAVNAGEESLSAGDVVAVVGAADPLLGDIPLARVVKASRAYQTGVMGVVDRRYLAGETMGFDDEPIAPGEHLSLVTHGMFRLVKVDASSSAIHAGDLLVSSSNAGYAMKAENQVEAIGAVIGKAMGELERGTGTLPLMVTLQ